MPEIEDFLARQDRLYSELASQESSVPAGRTAAKLPAYADPGPQEQVKQSTGYRSRFAAPLVQDTKAAEVHGQWNAWRQDQEQRLRSDQRKQLRTKLDRDREAKFRSEGVEYFSSPGMPLQPVRDASGKMLYKEQKGLIKGADEQGFFRVDRDRYGNQVREDETVYTFDKDEPGQVYRHREGESGREKWQPAGALKDALENTKNPRLQEAAQRHYEKWNVGVADNAKKQIALDRYKRSQEVAEETRALVGDYQQASARLAELTEASRETSWWMATDKAKAAREEMSDVQQRLVDLQSRMHPEAAEAVQMGDEVDFKKLTKAALENDPRYQQIAGEADKWDAFLAQHNGDAGKALNEFERSLEEEGGDPKSSSLVKFVREQRHQAGFTTETEEKERKETLQTLKQTPAYKEIAQEFINLDAQVESGQISPEEAQVKQQEIGERFDQKQAEINAKEREDWLSKKKIIADAFSSGKMRDAEKLFQLAEQKENFPDYRGKRDNQLGMNLADDKAAKWKWAKKLWTSATGDEQGNKDLDSYMLEEVAARANKLQTEAAKAAGRLETPGLLATVDPKFMEQAEREIRDELLATFDGKEEEAQRYVDHSTWSQENADKGWKVSPLTGELQLHDSLTSDPAKRDHWISTMAQNPEALQEIFGPDAKWEAGTEQKLKDAFQRYEDQVIGQQVQIAKELDSFKEFRNDYISDNPGADDREAYDAWIEDAGFWTKLGIGVSRATGAATGLMSQVMAGGLGAAMDKMGSDPEDIAELLTKGVNAWSDSRKDARLGQFAGVVSDTLGQFGVMALTQAAMRKLPGKKGVAYTGMIAEGMAFGLAEGSGNYISVYETNIANGATEAEAHRMGIEAMHKSIPAGLLELLPIDRIFAKIPVSKAKHLLTIMANAGLEGAQESLQNEVSNIIRRSSSDAVTKDQLLPLADITAIATGAGLVGLPTGLARRKGLVGGMESSNPESQEAMEWKATIDKHQDVFKNYLKAELPQSAIDMGADDPGGRDYQMVSAQLQELDRQEKKLAGMRESANWQAQADRATAAGEPKKAAGYARKAADALKGIARRTGLADGGIMLEDVVQTQSSIMQLRANLAAALPEAEKRIKRAEQIQTLDAGITAATPEAMQKITPDVQVTPEGAMHFQKVARALSKISMGEADALTQSEESALEKTAEGEDSQPRWYRHEGEVVITDEARNALKQYVPAFAELLPSTEAQRKREIVARKKEAEKEAEKKAEEAKANQTEANKALIEKPDAAKRVEPKAFNEQQTSAVADMVKTVTADETLSKKVSEKEAQALAEEFIADRGADFAEYSQDSDYAPTSVEFLEYVDQTLTNKKKTKAKKQPEKKSDSTEESKAEEKAPAKKQPTEQDKARKLFSASDLKVLDALFVNVKPYDASKVLNPDRESGAAYSNGDILIDLKRIEELESQHNLGPDWRKRLLNEEIEHAITEQWGVKAYGKLEWKQAMEDLATTTNKGDRDILNALGTAYAGKAWKDTPDYQKGMEILRMYRQYVTTGKVTEAAWQSDDVRKAQESALKALVENGVKKTELRGIWQKILDAITRTLKGDKIKNQSELASRLEGMQTSIEMFVQTAVKDQAAVEKEAKKADTNATEAQKEAGNYQKGHVPWKGLDISIETPAGAKRKTEWPALKNIYGYIKGTEGADGDQVDVFIESSGLHEDFVYIVDQVDPDAALFDEHKVMIGFEDAEAARKAYNANYQKGWKGLGAITPMHVNEFKEWLKDSDNQLKPVSKDVKGKADADALLEKKQRQALKNFQIPRKGDILDAIDDNGGILSRGQARKSASYRDADYEDATALKGIYLKLLREDGLWPDQAAQALAGKYGMPTEPLVGDLWNAIGSAIQTRTEQQSLEAREAELLKQEKAFDRAIHAKTRKGVKKTPFKAADLAPGDSVVIAEQRYNVSKREVDDKGDYIALRIGKTGTEYYVNDAEQLYAEEVTHGPDHAEMIDRYLITDEVAERQALEEGEQEWSDEDTIIYTEETEPEPMVLETQTDEQIAEEKRVAEVEKKLADLQAKKDAKNNAKDLDTTGDMFGESDIPLFTKGAVPVIDLRRRSPGKIKKSVPASEVAPALDILKGSPTPAEIRAIADAYDVKPFLLAKAVKEGNVEEMIKGMFPPNSPRHLIANGIMRRNGTVPRLDEVTRGAVPAAQNDAEYLKAVETGDTEKAQRMVNDAAKSAGYQVGPVKHGSGVRFDTFKKEFAGGSTGGKSALEAFFFTDGDRTAKNYAVYSAEAGPVKRLIAQAEAAERKGDWDAYQRYLEAAEEADTADATNKRREDATIYNVFLKGNFKEIDAEGESPGGLEGDFDEFDGSITKLIKQAKREKYDGVLIRNLDDAPSLSEVANHWAVFNSNQIKSADPVTYDESGKMIPLSKRFDSTDDRITHGAVPTKEERAKQLKKAKNFRPLPTYPDIDPLTARATDSYDEWQEATDKWEADLVKWEADYPQNIPIILRSKGINRRYGVAAITRDVSGGWRSTIFDQLGPVGHSTHDTRLNALREESGREFIGPELPENIDPRPGGQLELFGAVPTSGPNKQTFAGLAATSDKLNGQEIRSAIAGYAPVYYEEHKEEIEKADYVRLRELMNELASEGGSGLKTTIDKTTPGSKRKYEFNRLVPVTDPVELEKLKSEVEKTFRSPDAVELYLFARKNGIPLHGVFNLDASAKPWETGQPRSLNKAQAALYHLEDAYRNAQIFLEATPEQVSISEGVRWDGAEKWELVLDTSRYSHPQPMPKEEAPTKEEAIQTFLQSKKQAGESLLKNAKESAFQVKEGLYSYLSEQEPFLREALFEGFLTELEKVSPEPKKYYDAWANIGKAANPDSPNKKNKKEYFEGNMVPNDVREKLTSEIEEFTQHAIREAASQIATGDFSAVDLATAANPQAEEPEAGLDEFGGAVALAVLNDLKKHLPQIIELSEEIRKRNAEIEITAEIEKRLDEKLEAEGLWMIDFVDDAEKIAKWREEIKREVENENKEVTQRLNGAVTRGAVPKVSYSADIKERYAAFKRIGAPLKRFDALKPGDWIGWGDSAYRVVSAGNEGTFKRGSRSGKFSDREISSYRDDRRLVLADIEGKEGTVAADASREVPLLGNESTPIEAVQSKLQDALNVKTGEYGLGPSFGAVPDHKKEAARVIGTIEHSLNEGARALFKAVIARPLSVPHSKMMNYLNGTDLGKAGLEAARTTMKKVKRQVAPMRALPREQLAWFLEANQAKSFNGGKMREVVKVLAEGGEVGSLGILVSKELAKPEMRKKMFNVMEGRAAIESLPAEAQPLMQKLRKMLDDYAKEAVKMKLMSPETYRANRIPDANGRTYMPRYFYDYETKTPGANVFKWYANKLRGLKAQTTSAFHIYEADKMGQPVLDADNNPKLIAEPGRGTWRFPNAQERDVYYEQFIREKTIEALHTPSVQDKYAEAREGLKKLTIDDVNRMPLLDEQVRLAYRAEIYNMRERYKKRDPLNEQELEKAGLIEDVAYSVPKALMSIKHDIETAKLFNKIAKAGFALDEETKGYKQIPDNYKFGELRGKWVQNHLAEQLLDYAYAMPETALDTLDDILKYWKLGKTVWNPPTHFRNVMGNVPFADLAGINPMNPANWHYYRQALEVIGDSPGRKNKLLNKAGSLIPGKKETTVTRDELMEAAMIGTDFATAELQDALKDILPPLINETKSVGFFAALGKALEGKALGAAGAVTTGAVNKVKWTNEQLLYLYGLEDAVFKAASYIQQRDMGRTRDEAILHVRKWFPFYDQIGTSPLLRGARRSVFPFLSFTHEALRIMGHATTEKPVTMAKWMMMPGLLSYGAMAALGLDDEDQEDVLRDMRGQLRGFEGVPLASIILPFRVDGEITQWDLTATLPWGAWVARRYADERQKPLLQDVAQWLATASPLIGTGGAIAFNTDPFTGRKITKPGMDKKDEFFDEALAEQMKFTWDQAMPPMLGVRNNPLRNLIKPEPKGRLLQTPSRTQSALRQGLGVAAQTAQPNIYRIANEFREELGLPTTDEMDFAEPSPKLRMRREIYDSIVTGNQDRLNEAVQRYAEEAGEQIRNAQDISRLIDSRKPENLISRNKVIQGQFRRHLRDQHPEAWKSYQAGIKEFSKVRQAAPRMLMEANRQLLTATP